MQAFSYVRAETVEGAIAAFATAGNNARYIAGGTTLYDLMKLGIERPAHLIDISEAAAIDEIETGGPTLRFGSMARMHAVAETAEVRKNYPVLAESLLKAASQQLRNMATIGGNLLQRTRCAYFREGNGVYPCNKRHAGSGCAAIGGLDRGHAVLGTSESCIAVSPGDWPVALVAMDAQIEIAGPHGRRQLPVNELYCLPKNTPEREFALAPGEIITAVIVAKTAAGRASTYHKIRDRESYAFALAAAAVALEMSGGSISAARVALGGVATVPWRARGAEEMLRGKQLTPALAMSAGHAAFEGARYGRDNRFKLELGARTVADALLIAAERGHA